VTTTVVFVLSAMLAEAISCPTGSLQNSTRNVMNERSAHGSDVDADLWSSDPRATVPKHGSVVLRHHKLLGMKVMHSWHHDISTTPTWNML